MANSIAAKYDATQVKAEINKIQKEIGKVMKAKENPDELKAQKIELDKKHKALEAAAVEKLDLLNKKVNTVGNYVHESVPVSDNEVWAINMQVLAQD